MIIEKQSSPNLAIKKEHTNHNGRMEIITPLTRRNFHNPKLRKLQSLNTKIEQKEKHKDRKPKQVKLRMFSKGVPLLKEHPPLMPEVEQDIKTKYLTEVQQCSLEEWGTWLAKFSHQEPVKRFAKNEKAKRISKTREWDAYIRQFSLEEIAMLIREANF